MAVLFIGLFWSGILPQWVSGRLLPEPAATKTAGDGIKAYEIWQAAHPGQLKDDFESERNELARVPATLSASLDQVLLADGRLLTGQKLLAYQPATNSTHTSNPASPPLPAHVLSASADAVLWSDGLVNIKGSGLDVRYDAEQQRYLYNNLMRDDMGLRSIEDERRLQDNVAISSGAGFTLVLKRDGTVWGSGSNKFGQLGMDNRETGKPVVPIGSVIAGLSNVIAISASAYHGLALKSDGTVWRWGHDGDQGLDYDKSWYTTNEFHGRFSSKVEQVPVLTDIVKIASGHTHYLALKRDGTVWSWGNNNHGQINTSYTPITMPESGTTTSFISQPVKIEGLDQVSDIAAAQDHNLALRADGSVWAWGRMYHGEMGRPLLKVDEDTYTPGQVMAGPEFWSSRHVRPMRDVTKVKRIFTSYGASTLLLEDDTVKVIGRGCQLCKPYEIEQQRNELKRAKTASTNPPPGNMTGYERLDSAINTGNFVLANQILARGTPTPVEMKNAILALLKNFEDPNGGQLALLKKLLPSVAAVFNDKTDAELLWTHTYALGCRHWYAAQEVFHTPGLFTRFGEEIPSMFVYNEALPYPQATPLEKNKPAQPCRLRTSPDDYMVAAPRKKFETDYAVAVIDALSDEQIAAMFPRFNPMTEEAYHQNFYKISHASLSAIEALAIRKEKSNGKIDAPALPVHLFLNELDTLRRDDPRVSDPALAWAWIKKHNQGITDAELEQLFSMHNGKRLISTTARGLRLQHNAILAVVNAMLQAGAEAKPHVKTATSKVYKNLSDALKTRQAIFVCPVNDVFNAMHHVRDQASSLNQSTAELERTYVMQQSLVPNLLKLYQRFGAVASPQIPGYVKCPEFDYKPGSFK